jgi:hypothetical protein
MSGGDFLTELVTGVSAFAWSRRPVVSRENGKTPFFQVTGMFSPRRSFKLPERFENFAMSITPHVYKVRPRKDHRGVDLISDALPFGGL